MQQCSLTEVRWTLDDSPGNPLDNPVVGPAQLEGVDVSPDRAMQMSLPHKQHVIEAFSPDTSEEPFTDRVGGGDTEWGLDDLNSVPLATRGKASKGDPSRSRIGYCGVRP